MSNFNTNKHTINRSICNALFKNTIFKRWKIPTTTLKMIKFIPNRFMRVFLLILLKYLFPDVYIFLLILSIFFHIAIKKTRSFRVETRNKRSRINLQSLGWASGKKKKRCSWCSLLFSPCRAFAFRVSPSDFFLISNTRRLSHSLRVAIRDVSACVSVDLFNYEIAWCERFQEITRAPPETVRYLRYYKVNWIKLSRKMHARTKARKFVAENH